MKSCRKCLETKELIHYHKDLTNKDGLHPYCKNCRSIERKLFHKNNKEKENKRNREYEKRTKKARKNAKLKYRYGITLEQYNKMLDKQQHKCYICKEDAKNLSKKLAVDHCHNTKKVRGLLCSNCNTALGMFKDNINFLKNAITYLKE